jgi:hypothetical protein
MPRLACTPSLLFAPLMQLRWQTCTTMPSYWFTWGLDNFCPRLALTCHPPDLCLLNSWDDRHEPPGLSLCRNTDDYFKFFPTGDVNRRWRISTMWWFSHLLVLSLRKFGGRERPQAFSPACLVACTRQSWEREHGNQKWILSLSTPNLRSSPILLMSGTLNPLCSANLIRHSLSRKR